MQLLFEHTKEYCKNEQNIYFLKVSNWDFKSYLINKSFVHVTYNQQVLWKQYFISKLINESKTP